MEKKLTLKILSSRDFNKLPYKDVQNSQGITDTKRNIAFIRARRSKADLNPVIMHEVLELLAMVSPHDEQGIRYKQKAEAPTLQYTTPPEPTYTMSPENKWLWETISKPYTESQYGLYEDVYEPTSRQLGGLLQADLTEPFDASVYEDIWRKSRENVASEYAPVERKTAQRFASTGALDTSGQTQKAFMNLESEKMGKLEDMAVSQAIDEWTQRQKSKQQAYSNIFQYMGGQPSFSMPQSIAQEAQPYLAGGSPAKLNAWENIGSLFSPVYGDILRSQGYSAPGMTTQQALSLVGGQIF